MSLSSVRQVFCTFLFYFRSKPQLCEVRCSSLQFRFPSGLLSTCVRWSTESVAFVRGLVVTKVRCFGVLNGQFVFSVVRFLGSLPRMTLKMVKES